MDNNQELEFALDKLNKLGRRLDLNISVQALLAVVGVLTLLSPNNLENFQLIFEYDVILASLLVPILLIYFFIQFGYMLYNYHALRKLVDLKANQIYQDDPLGIQRLYNIFRENRMAEMIYMKLKLHDIKALKMKDDDEIPKHKFPVYHLWIFSIMTLLSINHAVVFSFTINHWTKLGPTVALLFLILTLGIFVGLYRDYILLAKNKNFIRLTYFNSALTIFLLLLFMTHKFA